MHDVGMFLKTCRRGEVGRERRARRRNFHAGLTLPDGRIQQHIRQRLMEWFNNRGLENSRRGAFTALELLAVIAICFILFLVVAPALSRPHRPAHRIKCVNNLKNLGLAFRIYAVDNGDRFPWQDLDEKGAIRVRYEADPAVYVRAASNELSTPKIVICTTDTRKVATNWNQFTRENLSFFISADAAQEFPGSFMAGDRNITNENGRLPAGFGKLSTKGTGAAGWDGTMHKEQGNVCMGDGSVQQLSRARLREQLRNTEQTLTEITISVP